MNAIDRLARRGVEGFSLAAENIGHQPPDASLRDRRRLAAFPDPPDEPAGAGLQCHRRRRRPRTGRHMGSSRQLYATYPREQ